MPLRPTQVETLRVVEREGGLTAYDLAAITGRPSRERLEGLRYEGFLVSERLGIDESYSLTQLGHEALEGSK
jgi:hypothetical protein